MAFGRIVEEVLLKFNTKKAEDNADKFEKKMTSSFIKGNLAAAALTKTLAVVGGQLKASVTAALEYEKTTIRLTNALRQSGELTRANLNVLQLQASQLERLTGISDEVTRSMLSQALAMGASTEQADDFTRAAISVANATGRDVQSAMQQLTKTLGGYAGELGEVIPEIKELSKEELRAGKAAELMNEKFGEFLDQGTKGNIGKLTNISNAVANIGESFALAIANTELFQNSLTRLGNLGFVLEKMQSEGFSFGEAFFGLATMGPEEMAALAQRYRKQEDAFLKAAEAQAGAAGALPFFARDVGTAGQTFSGDILAAGGTLEGTVKGKPKGGKPSSKEKSKLVFVPGVGMIGEDAANEILKSQETQAFQQQMIQDTVDAQTEQSTARLLAIESTSDMAIDIHNQEVDAFVAGLERQIEAEEMMQNQRQQLASRTASFVTDTALDGLEALLSGQEFSFEQAAIAFLKQTGRQMIGSGIQHIMAGTAISANPLTPGAGAGMIAVGQQEVAVGGGMFATGAVAGGMGFGGGGGGSSGGGTRSAAGGFVGGGAGSTAMGFLVNPMGAQIGLGQKVLGSLGFGGGGGGSGPSRLTLAVEMMIEEIRAAREEREKAPPINIKVNGALSPAEAGRHIHNSLEAAREEGLLR